MQVFLPYWQRLTETSELENMEFIKDLNLNYGTPVVDRYSPLLYALEDCIHRVMAKHAGNKNFYWQSFNHSYIFYLDVSFI